MRDLASVLAVAHHADATADDRAIASADVWCRLALARALSRRLTAADHAAVAGLGKGVTLVYRKREARGYPSSPSPSGRGLG